MIISEGTPLHPIHSTPLRPDPDPCGVTFGGSVEGAHIRAVMDTFTINQFVTGVGHGHVTENALAVLRNCNLLYPATPLFSSPVIGLPGRLRCFRLSMVTRIASHRETCPRRFSVVSPSRVLGMQGSNRPRNRVISRADSGPLFRYLHCPTSVNALWWRLTKSLLLHKTQFLGNPTTEIVPMGCVE